MFPQTSHYNSRQRASDAALGSSDRYAVVVVAAVVVAVVAAVVAVFVAAVVAAVADYSSPVAETDCWVGVDSPCFGGFVEVAVGNFVDFDSEKCVGFWVVKITESCRYERFVGSKLSLNCFELDYPNSAVGLSCEYSGLHSKHLNSAIPLNYSNSTQSNAGYTNRTPDY